MYIFQDIHKSSMKAPLKLSKWKQTMMTKVTEPHQDLEIVHSPIPNLPLQKWSKNNLRGLQFMVSQNNLFLKNVFRKIFGKNFNMEINFFPLKKVV